MELRIFKVKKVLTSAMGIAKNVYGDNYYTDPAYFINRVKDAMVCSECGESTFNLYPPEFVAVKEGGKPYLECAKCGNISHL